ncbi:hypothetical protein CRN76_05060 [Chryseobacterium indologenes]|uniref:hypothetical protein n=1 Tax=Chryseobacterium indologenes TaxID=253 RepID=UPI000BFBBF86|nr:hypothetical protein [Chryseobacterium indologenes]ATN04813.1 hypothetical protein CRN76_05060 [Chryseobacterium indologenes]AYY86436.1 hypothetical protein EGX91_18705 [Chryseobacterium indologenes]QIX83328.1 hypothetical protein FOB56_19690 [Chryseobacterium indologenes]UDQ53017.1 hypothetical protein LJF28_16475 [Chryseobacterium indologenes]HAO27903.1 hypothetical protein [Chryseobacterium indologenes]
MKAHKRSKFAVSMKKSFYISLTFLLILFLTTITGFTNNRKSIYVSSSQDQMGLKASDIQQHDILILASMAENDIDLDKAFFDLPFILLVKNILFSGLQSGSGAIISSASQHTHPYHLPRYLLFHNLKIRISGFSL